MNQLNAIGKMAVPFLVLFLMSSLAFAQGSGEGGPGPEPISAGPGAGNQTVISPGPGVPTLYRAGTASELGQMIQQRQQTMAREMEGMEAGTRAVYQNQNRVRVAVHALLAMEDLVGGVGPRVSEVARNFNNSVQATIRAEEKVQRRDFVSRLFFGGDQEAAGELERETNRTRNMIQELKQLRDQCDCPEEVRNMFQEQIQNMELEQTRLQELAQNEKGNRGLFGWLFG